MERKGLFWMFIVGFWFLSLLVLFWLPDPSTVSESELLPKAILNQPFSERKNQPSPTMAGLTQEPAAPSRVVCKKGYDSCLVKNLFFFNGSLHVYMPDEPARNMLLNQKLPGYGEMTVTLHSSRPPPLFSGIAPVRHPCLFFSFDPKYGAGLPHQFFTLMAAHLTMSDYGLSLLETELYTRWMPANYPLSLLLDGSPIPTFRVLSQLNSPVLFSTGVVGISRRFLDESVSITPTAHNLTTVLREYLLGNHPPPPVPLLVVNKMPDISLEEGEETECQEALKTFFGTKELALNFQELTSVEKALSLASSRVAFLPDGEDAAYALLMPPGSILFLVHLNPQPLSEVAHLIREHLDIFLVVVSGQLDEEGRTASPSFHSLQSSLETLTLKSSPFLSFASREGFGSWVLDFAAACDLASATSRTLIVHGPWFNETQDLTIENYLEISNSDLPCHVVSPDAFSFLQREISVESGVYMALQGETKLVSLLSKLFPKIRFSPETAMVAASATASLEKLQDTKIVSLLSPSSFHYFGVSFKPKDLLWSFVSRSGSSQFASILNSMVFSEQVRYLVRNIEEKLGKEYSCLRFLRGKEYVAFCNNFATESPKLVQKCSPPWSGVIKFLQNNNAPRTLYISQETMNEPPSALESNYDLFTFFNIFPGRKRFPMELETVDYLVCSQAPMFYGSYLEPLTSLILEKRRLANKKFVHF